MGTPDWVKEYLWESEMESMRDWRKLGREEMGWEPHWEEEPMVARWGIQESKADVIKEASVWEGRGRARRMWNLGVVIVLPDRVAWKS